MHKSCASFLCTTTVHRAYTAIKIGRCPAQHGPDERGTLMIIFAWIGQIILFFLCWRVFLWGATRLWQKQSTMWADLIANLLLAIVLLIVIHLTQSGWWLMSFFGAIVGVVISRLHSKT